MGLFEGCCKGFFLVHRRKKHITINGDLPDVLQKVVLAHELGHCVLHSGSSSAAFHEVILFDTADQKEYEANVFASELLLEAEGKERFVESEDRAVILFGKHASIYSDRQYQKTISDKENFYPSPSVFIYTLPNIVTGEIALRNKYHGETSYFALEDKTEMERHIRTILDTTPSINSAICGWIDAVDLQHFEAEIYIIIKKTDNA